MNTTPRDMGLATGAASTGSLEFREPEPPREYDSAQQEVFREGYLEGRAWRLGQLHGSTAAEPFGDLDQGGEALLMDALGESGWTTEDNHPLRLKLLVAYKEARELAERDAPE